MWLWSCATPLWRGHPEAIIIIYNLFKAIALSNSPWLLAFHGGLCDSFLPVFVVARGVPGPWWSEKSVDKVGTTEVYECLTLVELLGPWLKMVDEVDECFLHRRPQWNPHHWQCKFADKWESWKHQAVLFVFWGFKRHDTNLLSSMSWALVISCLHVNTRMPARQSSMVSRVVPTVSPTMWPP